MKINFKKIKSCINYEITTLVLLAGRGYNHA